MRGALLVGAGGSTRGTQQPPQQNVAYTFGSDYMRMLEGAGDFAAALAFDPVTFRIGALMGVRYVTAPLFSAYQQQSCGRHSLFCEPRAAATLGLFQPRASLDCSLGRFSDSFGRGAQAAVGAFVGVDTYPDRAWTFGVAFNVRIPQWELAP